MPLRNSEPAPQKGHKKLCLFQMKSVSLIKHYYFVLVTASLFLFYQNCTNSYEHDISLLIVSLQRNGQLHNIRCLSVDLSSKAIKSEGRGFKSRSDLQLELFHDRSEFNSSLIFVISQLVRLLPVVVVFLTLFFICLPIQFMTEVQGEGRNQCVLVTDKVKYLKIVCWRTEKHLVLLRVFFCFFSVSLQLILNFPLTCISCTLYL